jgi:3-oxoacyl-(acyl-carrier-protein) synthase
MSWDITGMGAIANVGTGPDEIFDALCVGREARAQLRAFDVSKYRSRYAYEIDDRAEPGQDEPLRATRWLRLAIEQALADAGLGEDLSDIPVLVGTTLREQRSAELWWQSGAAFNPAEFYFGTDLRASFGAESSYTLANACSASLYALALATDLIELGAADTVVVGGTDAITESAFGTLDRVQNESPDALTPFDESHKGMLMGEGAVAVVLQRAGTAAGKVRARLRSVGVNCDANHPTAPDQDSIGWVIRDAHRRAGVVSDDIDLVMLHGTGTPRNDETEAAVLTDVFGGSKRPDGAPLMTAIKSMTGHTLGGSGLLSLVMAIRSIESGRVPPVRGLTTPIDEVAGLSLIQGTSQAADISMAQVNSFGFGGINAVAVMEAVR